MSNSETGVAQGALARFLGARRKVMAFAGVALVWLVFDILTKQYFNGAYERGEVISEPILGLFRFKLVHNTGAAWGLFGDSTQALGVMSVVVCLIIFAYFFFSVAHMNKMEVFGLGLVFAGGIGNGIDRFNLGYVVDFIDLTFIQFPVFNIADIGVTCGFVLVLIGIVYSWRKQDAQPSVAETVQANGGVSSENDDVPEAASRKDRDA